PPASGQKRPQQRGEKEGQQHLLPTDGHSRHGQKVGISSPHASPTEPAHGVQYASAQRHPPHVLPNTAHGMVENADEQKKQCAARRKRYGDRHVAEVADGGREEQGEKQQRKQPFQATAKTP